MGESSKVKLKKERILLKFPLHLLLLLPLQVQVLKTPQENISININKKFLY
jgi:hypothetical protein